jgi:chaperonin GroES
MQAIRNKIIVSIGSTVEKSASGIVVDANKKPDRGVVISKGAEVTDEIEEGDTVVFSEFAGKEIKEGADKYITLNEGEVYYVIKK